MIHADPAAGVSVVIPVFNGERYVGEAIRSVLAQTHTGLDVIVVDDGSTDRTADVVRTFGSRVRYHVQPNAGAAAARDRGIQMAHGAFLAFLDADDVWVHDKLGRQMAAFSAEPELEAVSGMVEQFVSPELADRLALPSRMTAPVRGIIPSAIVIRRAALDRIGPFASKWRTGEFAAWYVRAAEAGLRLKVLPMVVARRRIHLDNQGMRYRHEVAEYAGVLKESLDRRRAVRRPEDG